MLDNREEEGAAFGFLENNLVVRESKLFSTNVLDDQIIISADQFLKSALEYHNKLRAIHKSPPLRINKQMSKEAEKFAKMLAQHGMNSQATIHENQLLLQEKNEGQNLASGGGKVGELTAKDAVKYW